MSYTTQNKIASSAAMQGRVAACAAEQQTLHPDLTIGDPDLWTWNERRYWAAAPGWSLAWEYAENTHEPPGPQDPPQPPYDPGADPAVITDDMILAEVQRMLDIVQPKPQGAETNA